MTETTPAIPISKLSQLISEYEKDLFGNKVNIDIGFNESGIFHIHPWCLINNYLMKREEFKDRLFKIISESIKPLNNDYSKSIIKSQIEADKVQIILDHFGISGFTIEYKYKSIESPNIFESNMINNKQTTQSKKHRDSWFISDAELQDSNNENWEDNASPDGNTDFSKPFNISNFKFGTNNDMLNDNNTEGEDQFGDKPLIFSIPNKIQSNTNSINDTSKSLEEKKSNTNSILSIDNKPKTISLKVNKSHNCKHIKQVSSTTMSLLVNYSLLINHNHLQSEDAQKRMMYLIFIELGNHILNKSLEIYNSIKDKSYSELMKDVKRWQMTGNLSTIYGTKNYLSKDIRIVYRKLYQWKKQGINAIENDGYMLFRKGFEIVRKYYFNEYIHICISISMNIFSKIPIQYMTCNYNHYITKVYLVAAICMTNNIIKRVSLLTLLSLNCYSNKEYMIAWKLINISHLLSNGYFTSKELNIVYEQRNIMRKKVIKIMKCAYCKIKPNNKNKCKVCIGCMKKMYCSKKCQKRHWNEKHRFKCNKTWSNLYVALKTTFFDRL